MFSCTLTLALSLEYEREGNSFPSVTGRVRGE
jgi:hypothetical protein